MSEAVICIFIGLARHEAGWPWVDSMSRSKVYRRVNLFLISLLIILDVKTQIAPRAAARTNKIKNKNISPPVVPIAAAREYLQLNAFFSNLGKKLCNIMFSLASA